MANGMIYCNFSEPVLLLYSFNKVNRGPSIIFLSSEIGSIIHNVRPSLRLGIFSSNLIRKLLAVIFIRYNISLRSSSFCLGCRVFTLRMFLVTFVLLNKKCDHWPLYLYKTNMICKNVAYFGSHKQFSFIMLTSYVKCDFYLRQLSVFVFHTYISPNVFVFLLFLCACWILCLFVFLSSASFSLSIAVLWTICPFFL